jgi:hypothetical protein
MIRYWRIRNGIGRLRLTGARFLRLLKEEIRIIILDVGRYVAQSFGIRRQGKIIANKIKLISQVQHTTHVSLNARFGSEDKPVIFASACVDQIEKGDWKYCGGIKELNILVKLLRIRGYEAYMVTYDGTYEPWLIEHQPHISIDAFRSRLQKTKNVRCVTSFAIANTFIRECQNLYFWDMDLCVTDHSHFPALVKLYRNKIKSVGTISRTIQAWHMANFERPCTVIPNLLDTSLWHPLAASRVPLRIGYMDEGPHTPEYIAMIGAQLKECRIEPDFNLILGNEAEVLADMRSCEIFLSMNIGKDPLWGEGCPRTIIEALSVGCVVIAFDLIGNRETLVDGFNGIIVERSRPDLMAQALVDFYQNPGRVLRMRENALSLINSCHTLDARWPAIKKFLDL